MHQSLRLSPLLAALLLATGCALLPQPEVGPPAAGPPPTAAAPPDTSHYRITAAELEIHTFKAGWLAGLSHAHVLETRAVGGDIHLAKPVAGSSARLYFRPWDLELDNPDSRAAAGAGFESTRTAEDIAATRTRMLGPRGFHSSEYPWVVIDVGWLDPEQVNLNIHFRDGSHPFTVPLDWSIENGVIKATADFELSHRALGIRPYSAFAGAIAVADRIRVQLTLSARAAGQL
jgi:hypothetical protein